MPTCGAILGRMAYKISTAAQDIQRVEIRPSGDCLTVDELREALNDSDEIFCNFIIDIAISNDGVVELILADGLSDEDWTVDVDSDGPGWSA